MRWWPAVVVVGLLLAGGCGDDAPSSSDAALASGTSTTTSSTAPATAATPPPPELPVGVATRLGPDVPVSGFAVVDGDRLLIRSDDGTAIADGPAHGFTSNGRAHPLLLTVDGSSVRVAEVIRMLSDDRLAADCVADRAGDAVVVGRCGPNEAQLRRIDVADERGPRTLIGTPPVPSGSSEVLGHWSATQVSPDGAWVLALWSGECESPTTFVLPVGGGTGTTADGTPSARWADAPATVLAGWTADGRARFVMSGGACGTGAAVPGVYARRPGGRPELLHRAETPFPMAYGWRRVGAATTP